MSELIRQVKSKIQDLPENTLTNEYIIPLLKKLGFYKVEFYGGVSEKGKDILCWEKNKLGEIQLSVAQVKHFKTTNVASDSRSLQTIINQLGACFTDPLLFDSNFSYLPFEAYLISSYDIDTKTLETRFSSEYALRDKRIKSPSAGLF